MRRAALPARKPLHLPRAAPLSIRRSRNGSTFLIVRPPLRPLVPTSLTLRRAVLEAVVASTGAAGAGDLAMRIVVAVGANALLRRGERPNADVQPEPVLSPARKLAPPAASNQLVICHSNGPQVGVLVFASQNAMTSSQPLPLNVPVAEAPRLRRRASGSDESPRIYRPRDHRPRRFPQTGRPPRIGALADAAAIVAGVSGTLANGDSIAAHVRADSCGGAS